MAERPPPDSADTVRRALRRAGVHWLRAAIEVLEGVGAFVDEVRSSRRDDDDGDSGRQHIEVD
jgi:hypothetical protein